jgi:hypothetical protein
MGRALIGALSLMVVSLTATVARGEFQVNTYTTGMQQYADVAAHAGGFVVVWQSVSLSDPATIVGRRYDSTGTALTGEFQVNTATLHPSAPAVAADATGRSVVVWQQESPFDFEPDIVGRLYDGSGSPVGAQFTVNTYTTGRQVEPMAAMDASGNFVVVWSAETSTEEGRGIRAQRYDSGGLPLGTEFQVNTYTTRNQTIPAIAMQPGGEFVVVWRHDVDYAGRVFGQRYDASGAPLGGEFQVGVATERAENPAIAAATSGGFLVVWERSSTVRAQRFDAAGLPVTGEFVVNTHPTSPTYFGNGKPEVAANGTGFMVVWQTIQDEPILADVRAQRLDDAGLRVGDEFQINSYTLGPQSSPRVAVDGAGNFGVTWWGYDTEVFGQVNKPDRPIRGHRLHVRDRRGTEDGRSTLIIGKESATEIGPTLDGDPIADGATLHVVVNGTTSSSQTYVLDPAGWRTAGSTGFRYSGPTGMDGDPVKKVLIKRSPGGTALVKILLKGSIGTQPLDVVPPNTGTDGGIAFEIGGGGGRYCVSFGGAAGGNEVQDDATGWKVLSATAEPGCVTP